MANFKTHITTAAIGSGLLSTLCLGAGMIQAEQLILFSVLGTLGGILPDIDLDHAAPTKLLFTALGLLTAFFMLNKQAPFYSIIELWVLAGFSYALVRYTAWQWFNDLTQHRGIFHSLASALFFWFLTTALSHHVFNLGALAAWLAGAFVAYGFLIHLILDEIYSVDFINKRLKRSFGTALKPIDFKNLRTSAVMLICVVIAFVVTPSPREFGRMLFNPKTYYNVSTHFFPSGTWFNF
jgi:hypothetical protein